MTSDRARSALLLIGASLGFGSLGTLASIAYAAGMGSATFVTLRAVLGAVSLVGLSAFLHWRTVALARIPRREQVLLTAAVVLNGGFTLALFAAFSQVSVPVVLAIYFTYPTMVALISTALGRERLTPVRAAGLALAIAGVVLILADGLAGARVGMLGLAIAAAAAAAQAAYIVVARAGFPSVPAEQAIVLVLAGGAVMALPLALAVESDGGATGWLLDGSAWAAVAAASIVGTAIPKVWVLRGVRSLGGTRGAVVMLAEPVFGAILATLAIGQDFTMVQAAGGALVLLAALAVQRPAPGRAAVGAED